MLFRFEHVAMWSSVKIKPNIALTKFEFCMSASVFQWLLYLSKLILLSFKNSTANKVCM